jgi:hypothetical protein
MFIDSE